MKQAKKYHWIQGFSLLQLIMASAANAGTCEDLNTAQNVVNCALERHPTLRIASLDSEQAKNNISFASLRPNPEVNNQTTFGGDRSDSFYTELNFAHTFELGGKRNSRIEKAEANYKLSIVAEAQTREDVFLSVIQHLYRIRQIRDELETIDDALRTFSQMGARYRSRPSLNPDQISTLRIFEIAEQDYRLRKIPLESEQDFRSRELGIALGTEFTPNDRNLPPRKTVWPKLEAVPNGIRESTRLKQAHALAEIANADLLLAKGFSWPDLKIGPTVTTQRMGQVRSSSFGFNFTLPLPIYHLNGAGKTLAETSIQRAKFAQDFIERESGDQIEYYKSRYENAVKVLSSSLSFTEIARKHSEVESFFGKGFVSGTVVIEVHRQVSDFVKTFNEQELAAVESRARFYTLQGKIVGISE